MQRRFEEKEKTSYFLNSIVSWYFLEALFWIRHQILIKRLEAQRRATLKKAIRIAKNSAGKGIHINFFIMTSLFMAMIVTSYNSDLIVLKKRSEIVSLIIFE